LYCYDEVEQETSSYCCVCKDHYALYKGKHVCSNKDCKARGGYYR
jgi:hypothetical protein